MGLYEKKKSEEQHPIIIPGVTNQENKKNPSLLIEELKQEKT